MKPGAWFPGWRADAATRVFCLPHAGGGASAYHGWSSDAEVAFQPVQPPGREGRFREAAYTRITDYVADLASAIAPVLDRPYGLFGHSLGALVAFELARALRDRGHAMPHRLVVSACPGPRLPRRQLHDLPEPALLAELQRMGGVSPEVLAHRELLELVLPTLRADFEVVDRYHHAPGPPLTCPITALVGADDPLASAADAAGWADETSGPFRLHELPGDHFFLHADPAGVRALVRAEVVSP